MSDTPFRINGVSNPIDEPYPFLDQLHGILCCIEAAVADNSDGPMNPAILRSALRAAQTLAHLVGEGLEFMDTKREARS